MTEVRSYWRVLAIIFIILFVVETALIIWALNLGNQLIEDENECAYNVCAEYDTYYLDSDNVCTCFIDGEIYKQELIK